MKRVLTICCFLLGLVLAAQAQLGFSVAYHEFNTPDWQPENVFGFDLPQNYRFPSTIGYGFDYQFSFKKARIEFLPSIIPFPV